MPEVAAVILAALALDVLMGDPQWFPHPVRIIGLAITMLERRWNKAVLPRRALGIITVTLIVAGSWGITWLVGCAARAAGHWWYLGWSVMAVYFAIAARDLWHETAAVRRCLATGELEATRCQLARIVGRDTAGMSEKEIIRATVETVAENSSDGIIAPLLYAALGGPALAVTYKAVNTLDSMIGHDNARYREFGWFAARLDDVANFIPARLTALLMIIAAGLLRLHPARALRTMLTDARRHHSPNAGYPEAAAAGALGIQLGGTNIYQGLREERARLGTPDKKLELNDIAAVKKLMAGATVLFVILTWIIAHVMER